MINLDPVMDELFQKVIPFWDSDLSGKDETFKALWEEYACLDIEILRKADPEVRELVRRQVAVRKELDGYRDRYYFVQGRDKTTEKLDEFFRRYKTLLETMRDAQKDPPSK